MSLSRTDVHCFARLLKANMPATGMLIDPHDCGMGNFRNACAVAMYAVVPMHLAGAFIAELGFDPGLPTVVAVSYSDLSE